VLQSTGEDAPKSVPTGAGGAHRPGRNHAEAIGFTKRLESPTQPLHIAHRAGAVLNRDSAARLEVLRSKYDPDGRFDSYPQSFRLHGSSGP
jgi:hypothetical protein